MKTVTRTPKPGDLGWIILAHGELYASEFGFTTDFEINIARKIVYLFEGAAHPFNAFWITEVGDNRAGSIAISKRNETTAFINFVLVLNQYRRRGIARNLLDIAIRRCKEHGFKSIELETYSFLQNARRIYSGLGFEITSTEKGVSEFGQTSDKEFWALRL